MSRNMTENLEYRTNIYDKNELKCLKNVEIRALLVNFVRINNHAHSFSLPNSRIYEAVKKIWH